jgi:hypothetical protein
MLACAAALVAAPALLAQPPKITEEKPGLLKKAKISAEAASAAALGRVPGGKIESGEIENEGGKLIYSFDIKVAGKSGIDEVWVDATTGAVLNVAHETPAAETKEAQADKAKAAKAKAGTPAKAKPPAPPKKG